MNYNDLVKAIRTKQSFLCIGLDSDHHKIPPVLNASRQPVLEFNKRVIDATADLAVAYKLNIAFYEAMGAEGWDILDHTIHYLRTTYPGIFIIADAKRGDIGNTSKKYAEAFFHKLNADAITVAPYMGSDSVGPFLEYNDKWVILLALTSNAGADDFQYIMDDSGKHLFENVIIQSKEWGTHENMMYVVGATRAEQLREIRNIAPRNFLLIPGVGAQGGTLEEVVKYGMNEQCGLLVNSSRSIIFASDDASFDEAARKNAIEIQQDMKGFLQQYNII